MLVNFSFYVQKFNEIDAEYRILLTTFTENTYNRTILKEGFLYSNGKIVNKDQVVLDLPVNDSEEVKNYFEISISAVQTSRTKLNKPIKLNLLRLEVNDTPVHFMKKHVIHNSLITPRQNIWIIPESATISLLIPGSIILKDNNFHIKAHDYDINNCLLWTDVNNPTVPIILNNIVE